MKKLLTFFLTALLAFGVGWAETSTLTFTAACGGSGTADDNTVWTVTSDADESSYDGTKGIHYGTSKKAVSYLNLTTSGISGTITQIVVNASGASSTSAKLNVTVGGNAFGSEQSLTSSATNYTFTGSASGEIVVSLTQSSATKALYCKSITVTYTSGGSTTETCATPTFSPGEGTYTETQTVTILSETSGATIYYTTDGNDPTTSSSSIANGGTVSISSSCTLKAIAVKDGYNNSAVASATYYFSSGIPFELVTDASTLTAGDEIIFVSSGTAGSAYAMGYQNTNNRPGVTATVSSTLTVDDASNIETFTLEGSTGAWYFKANKIDQGYLYAASSSSNYLKTEATADDNAKATISISSNEATITFQGTYTHNLLKYNSSSHLFSCYASGQSPVYIYRRAGTPSCATPTFSPEAGEYTSAQSVEISCSTEGATIYYTTDGTDPTTSSSVYSSAINVSTTTTIKAIAVKEDYNNSAIATATYTINLTPTLSVEPTSLTINDSDNATNSGTATVSSANLTGDLSTTASTNWSAAIDATTLTVAYNGHALYQTGSATVSSINDNLSETVAATYQYTGSIYVFGNVNDNNWDFANGVEMTRNNDGTYQVDVTATAETNDTYSWIYFSRKNGNETDALAYKFGPLASGYFWALQGSNDYTGVACKLDSTLLGSNAYTIRMNPGEYRIVINPFDNSFTISALVHAPEFSVATGTYTETQSVIITSETSGATIYYTIDGTDPTTNSTVYSGAITVSETTTLKAIAVYNGVTSEITSATYTIKDPSETNYYTKVTSGGQIVVGQQYIFVSDDDLQGLNGFSSGGTGETILLSNSIADIYGTDVIEFILGEGYTFYVNDNSTRKYLNAAAQPSLNTSSSNWNITQTEDGGYVISYTSGSDTYTLRYNDGMTNDGKFRCYKNATGNPVYLYTKISTEPTISISTNELDLGTIEAGGASTTNTFTVHGSNLNGAVNITISDTENFEVSPTTISAADAMAGNVTVTVTYTGSDYSKTATVTVSSANSEFTSETVSITASRTPLAVTISPATGATFSGSSMSGTITSNVANATIEYSTNGGTTWNTYTDGFTVTAATVGETVTVQARATYNGETSETVTATYTRVAKSTTLFEKVTSTTQINAGNKYILVYETIPAAMQGAGYATNVQWSTTNVIDIAQTSATVFTLGGTSDDATLYYVDNGTTYYLTHSGKNTAFDTGANSLTITQDDTDFYVKEGSYILCYNAGDDPFRWYTSVNGTRAYLYVQGGTIEAPEITPSSGTYYESQTVSISEATAGTTVYYTTDGTDPATSSTREEYTVPFTVPYSAGTTTTIIAVAIDEEDAVSEPATVTYTWAAPSVTITPDSRNVTAESVTVTLTATPAGGTIYFTTDGTEPSATNGTEYTGAFTVDLENIGDAVTVKAITVYNGTSSAVASATYTRVEKVIEVNAPFFSPLVNQVYYGDQTLKIGCTTRNAEIYYEIVEVAGTTAPTADDVNDPTKASTYYGTETINMTEGNSYYVKAIAYIGNYASTISEGWYTVESFSDFQSAHSSDGYTYVANCAQFNALTTTQYVSFTNPVQVVYHSTYANNGETAEFCYVRDNTDYACIYFGKNNTSHDFTIFKMGDWIDGYEISGKTNTWENNFHIQLGSSDHSDITYWPSSTLGWTEILPEEITNDVIVAGTPTGSNSWGHYVHSRYTTLRYINDYSSSDAKHTGLINDGTAEAYYYDKFYRWSAGYADGNVLIHHIADYDSAFFFNKQAAGATFDVYGIVDYYSPYNPPFEICPIDFLWIYKPVISLETGTYYESQTVTITATQPEWAAESVVIYYKTDDMDDWAVYTGPITVNADTHLQAYAEVPAEKSDGTNYNDYVRSVTVDEIYEFAGVEDPEIGPASQVVEIVDGSESVTVTVMDNNDNPNAVTIYTTDGSTPSATNGTVLDEITEFVVDTTTTVSAVSYLVVAEGDTLWSNVVSETYTFVKKNGITYDIVTTAPKVGNVYVIVNKAAYMGLSNTQNETNRGSVGVMFTDDTKATVYGNDNLAQFVLEQATGNRYYFKNINGGNGYLCVETNDHANLVTAASHDGNGYDVATVAIGAESTDADLSYPATISFNYDGTTRYMRYYQKGRTFSTYSDGTLNQDVFLYGLEATPLATIENTGEVADVVTVADELIGTWAVDYGNIHLLWAKDQGNVSIDKTEPTSEQEDYMREILGLQVRDWDQSNWVILDMSDVCGANNTTASTFVNQYITGGTIKGLYADDVNYMIEVVDELPIIRGEATGYDGWLPDPDETNGKKPTDADYAQDTHYLYNQYCTGNFLLENLNSPYGSGVTSGTRSVFFMNPKVMEVAHIQAAMWNGSSFEAPTQNGTATNGLNIDGAFDVDWTYNRLAESNFGQPELTTGNVYSFHVAVMLKETATGNHKRGVPSRQGTAGSEFMVYPLDMYNNQTPTIVTEVVGNKTVESVRYYNIMGIESETPFEGINIVVTRYSDGTRSTAKVLR